MGVDRATATRLIEKWGVSAVIRVRGPRVADEGGGTLPPVLADYQCTAFEANRKIIEKVFGGALAGVNDQLFVISADRLAIVPSTNDFLRIHGTSFAIDETHTFRARGEVGFYIVRGKRNDP